MPCADSCAIRALPWSPCSRSRSGIAGTTVMFALIQGVLLRPLPVHEQDRLILAWKEVRTSGSARYPFGNTEIEAVADNSQLLEKAAGVTRNGVQRSVVTDNGVSTYANVALVTGGFFDVLGVQPILGRTLTLADEKDGAENVIVITSGFWQRRYGASREVVGRPLIVGEQPFRIVGVMPSDLDYPSGVEIWRTTSRSNDRSLWGCTTRGQPGWQASSRSDARAGDERDHSVEPAVGC